MISGLKSKQAIENVRADVAVKLDLVPPPGGNAGLGGHSPLSPVPWPLSRVAPWPRGPT